MQFKRLGRTGLLTSEIGFGASPLGDVFGRVEHHEVRRVTQAAIEQGITFSTSLRTTVARLPKNVSVARLKVIVKR